MNSNSENPKVGKAFQISVKGWFERNLHRHFGIEKKIAIGSPAKLHSFDVADELGQIVVECKCYTWTETGNVPSAKMGFVNEAAFYLSFLNSSVDRSIVMAKSTHPKRTETLAEYYFRTNRHLLGNTKILEYDTATDNMRLIGQN